MPNETEVTIDRKRKRIVIAIPLEKPRPSASGKTTLIGTSHGLVTGEARYGGRSVVAVANAFIFPDEPPHSGSGRRAPTDIRADVKPSNDRRTEAGVRGPVKRKQKSRGMEFESE